MGVSFGLKCQMWLERLVYAIVSQYDEASKRSSQAIWLFFLQTEHPDWCGNDLPPGWFSWKSLWAFTGPGALMSIAYIDPGAGLSNCRTIRPPWVALKRSSAYVM